jgi:hypothetical protein
MMAKGVYEIQATNFAHCAPLGANIINYKLFHVNYDAQLLRE